jgi:hypothetical protein
MRACGTLLRRGIGPYSRQVDPCALGYDLTALVELSIRQDSGGEARGALQRFRKSSTSTLLPVTNLRLRIVARDTTDLHRITNLLLETPGVLRTSTAISLVEEMPLRLTDRLHGRVEHPQPTRKAGIYSPAQERAKDTPPTTPTKPSILTRTHTQSRFYNCEDGTTVAFGCTQTPHFPRRLNPCRSSPEVSQENQAPFRVSL